MLLTRRSLFKGALGSAVLATGVGLPSVRGNRPDVSREAAVQRIAHWLSEQHTDREAVAILVSMNALLLRRHPDIASPARMMISPIEVIDRELVRAQEPRRLATRLSLGSREERLRFAAADGDPDLCRGEQCRKVETVDVIAAELRLWKFSESKEGRETRFFVPIDSPGLVVDPRTFQPYYPFQTYFGTMKARPGKQSGPKTMLVAQAA